MKKKDFNFDDAEKFLKLLDPNAKFWTFQCFHPDRKVPPSPMMHGTFKQHKDALADYNSAGHGVYVTINATDGNGRKIRNMVEIRAIWQEDDDGFGAKGLPFKPNMTVNTSPNKAHRYGCVEHISTRKVTKSMFDGVQKTLVAKYGSDNNARDITRVLRVPGFYNTKPSLDEPFLVTLDKKTHTKRMKWKKVAKKVGYTNGDAREPAEKEFKSKGKYKGAESWRNESPIYSDGTEALLEIALSKKYYQPTLSWIMAMVNKGVAGDVIKQMLSATYTMAAMINPSVDKDIWTERQEGIDQMIKSAEEKKEWEESEHKDNVIESCEEKDMEDVVWIWDERIPKAKVTIFAGDGGSGKTMFAGYFAALISQGKPAPYSKKPMKKGKTLIITSEDDLNDTLAPRFVAAGGNPKDLLRWNLAEESVDFKDNIEKVERYISKIKKLRLLVIDPIATFQGDIKGHNAGEISQVMGRIATMAKKLGIAVIGIMHINKSEHANTIDKISGSKAYTNSVRSTFLFHKNIVLAGSSDEDINGNVYFGTVKNNISAGSSVIEYNIQTKKVGGLKREQPYINLVAEYPDKLIAQFIVDPNAKKKNAEASRKERITKAYAMVADKILRKKKVDVDAATIDNEVILIKIAEFRKQVKQHTGLTDRTPSVNEMRAVDKTLKLNVTIGQRERGYTAADLINALY